MKIEIECPQAYVQPLGRGVSLYGATEGDFDLVRWIEKSLGDDYNPDIGTALVGVKVTIEWQQVSE